MKKNLIIVILFAFILASYACTAKLSQPAVSPGLAKKKIEKGLTSQEDIFKLFGAPNFVTTTKKDGELWVYSNYSTMSQGFNIGLGGFGGEGKLTGMAGGSVGSRSSRSVTLMITFDKNDVVIDFNVSQLQY